MNTVATGVEKKIRVKHLKKCDTCAGRGGKGEKACTQCKGQGRVRQVQQTMFGQFVNVGVCPRCEGQGSTVTEPCRECRGDGRVSDTEMVNVKVPPGVASGNYIPLRGLGDAGHRGGPAGDLIVLIEEKDHDVYERRGDDLYLEMPVPYTTLVLGGRLSVPLLGEEKAHTLDVAQATASGHLARVRGKGLPGLRGGRGDLLVRLLVWVPNKSNAAEKKLLEQLRELEAGHAPKPSRSIFAKVRDAFGG